MGEPRKFPRPWRVERVRGGWQVVDHAGMVLAWCYGRADLHALNPDRTLTPAEAGRIATWIARLPELISLARGEPAEGYPDQRRIPAWAPERRRHGCTPDKD